MGLSILRPKRFLVFFDLHFGVEFILLCTLINKVSGLYGVLAIFTDAEISALQQSMYIYSILFTVALALWYPQIQKQNPIGVLTFAHAYLLDSVCNALYTIIFGATWFLVTGRGYHSSPELAGPAGTVTKGGGGNGSGKDVGGFADNATMSVPSEIRRSQETMANTHATLSLSTGDVLAPESIASITIISTLWAIRIYFCLIVLAYARKVLQKSGLIPLGNKTSENDGWREKVGRALISINRPYWEGKGDECWSEFGLGNGRGRKWRDSGEFEGLHAVEAGIEVGRNGRGQSPATSE